MAKTKVNSSPSEEQWEAMKAAVREQLEKNREKFTYEGELSEESIVEFLGENFTDGILGYRTKELPPNWHWSWGLADEILCDIEGGTEEG